MLPGGDDDLIEMRIVCHDRCGRRLDEVSEVRPGKVLPNRTDSRRGKDDVTNLAQSYEQDFQFSI
jgi:hypothetical protein